MTTDYRALLLELVEAWESYCCADAGDATDRMTEAVKEARAALAKPEPVGPSMLRTERRVGPWGEWDALISARPATEPVGPTDEELEALAQELDDLPVTAPFAFARAVLSRWGGPAITPIPVRERLPTPEDCDVEGCC